KRVGLPLRSKLREKTFFYVAGPASDGLKLHYRLSRCFHIFDTAVARLSNLVDRTVKSSVFVKIADYLDRGTFLLLVEPEHMKLPFEVCAQRRCVRQELLKAGCVVLVFDLLSAIAGIEIILK